MSSVDDIKARIEALPMQARDDLLDWLFDTLDLQIPANRIAEAHPSYVDPGSRSMSIEEYLEFEEKTEQRHEYINGAVYALAGETVAHNQITVQLTTALSNHLRGGPCKVFSNGLKLKLELCSEDILYCPDVMVACRPEEWGKNFIRNPRLVAEVLSPSTQHIDRREKAINYHRVAAIEEYLILSQTESRVLVHRRAGRWEVETVSGRDAVLELRSLGVSMLLAEVYGDAIM